MSDLTFNVSLTFNSRNTARRSTRRCLPWLQMHRKPAQSLPGRRRTDGWSPMHRWTVQIQANSRRVKNVRSDIKCQILVFWCIGRVWGRGAGSAALRDDQVCSLLVLGILWSVFGPDGIGGGWFCVRFRVNKMSDLTKNVRKCFKVLLHVVNITIELS